LFENISHVPSGNFETCKIKSINFNKLVINSDTEFVLIFYLTDQFTNFKLYRDIPSLGGMT
jgi:hypothetical protein